MKTRSSLGFVLGVLLVAAPAAGRAQSVGRMVGYDVLHAGGDIVGTWAAPFHSSARDWLGAGAVLALSAAVSPVDDDIDRWFMDHQKDGIFSSLKEFREGGAAFAGSTITPAALGVYIIGVATKSRGIRDGVWGCVASYAAESVVRTQVMYRLVGRLRPDSIRGDHVQIRSEQGDQYKFFFPGSNAWGKHSLPAGHVANVTACASFLSHRFSNPYVTIPAYAIAAGVGVGRLVDRRHWTSDTVLGALLGYAAGKEVAQRSRERLHRDEGADNDGNGGGELLLGSIDGGMLIGWHLRF
ncbi:MAG TPA: phosphatase PAP2 family protein [Gemmatimonadaceae bacterium]|nr:phosphatase PAP2 family protein [Gemmatimonadaceae bacterium]